jgi:hypothetical protein
MIAGRMLRFLVAPAVLALTCGCVAAAIPAVAGTMIARKELAPGQAADPQPDNKPIVTLPADPPSAALEQVLPVAIPAFTSAEAAMPAGGAPFAGFAAFAASAAATPAAPGTPRNSALIDPASLIDGPRRLACSNQPPAVAINLDPGQQAFDLADPPAAAPGLGEALSAIRGAGVTVFWTSALPLDKADKVYAVLRALGLDLDGTDRLLLVRKAGETVQQRRLAAAKDWCFVALAGDRAADFEEAIDYLRDPGGPTARAMEPLMGDGWFVIPNPIN